MSGSDLVDPWAEKAGQYHPEAKSILEHLNATTGLRYRPVDSNLTIISARLNEPGVDADGVRTMIYRQTQLWKGTDMEKYLRPETLFRKSKFDAYYAARLVPVRPNISVNKTVRKDWSNADEEARAAFGEWAGTQPTTQTQP